MEKRSLSVILLAVMSSQLLSAASASLSRSNVIFIYVAVAVLFLALTGYFLLRKKKDK
ncbi:MAG: LPXTG cell wall anchor domain-containing protein [Bacteroidales bacterium]|jgi:LPXTG-motif cell wall-anchored protein|nr:LPXTG cell wall anchor domain-containing protein [Bacteroidales bacterium]